MPTQNHIQVAIACPADVETVQGKTGLTTTHSVLFFAPEYDPNHDTITGLINPGRSLSPFASPTIPPAYPLVKFMPSVSDKNYCVIVKVLPGYVFENPEHDFLRITLYIDGRMRVVRTVSEQQIVRHGSDRPYTIAIYGQGEGRNFYWKSIMIGVDDDAEPQPHDEWNYDLGSIQVYIHRMRAEEREGSGEDADDSDAVVEEKGEEEVEVDAGASGRVEGEEDEDEEEVEEDEDGEMEEAEREESGENEEEQDMILHKIDVRRRCLSHFTAYVCSRDICILLERIY
jgi:hypothetical protein